MTEMKILAHEENTDFIGCDVDLVWGAKNSDQCDHGNEEVLNEKGLPPVGISIL